MRNRRSFLQGLTSVPILGALVSTFWARAGQASRLRSRVVSGREYFKELAVKRVINATEPYTSLGGAPMWPEVVEAIREVSSQYYPVTLTELHDAVGKRIASMLGAEASMVSAGAASALTLGTAACLTSTDKERIGLLPDTTRMKSEVIIQKAHRFSYDRSVRACGIRFVEVETAEEVELVLTRRTAMMLFYNRHDPFGKIKAAEYAAMGREYNIPTFIDCASDFPPAENLTKFIKMGYSLVTFSGGKGLRGPQSAGVLFGRKDLIQAARLNTNPYANSIGRGMKVSKEELVGMLVALEASLKHDYDADWETWERRVKLIRDQLSTVRSLRTERFVPEITYRQPHLRLRWDETLIKKTPEEVVRELREGTPSIAVRTNDVAANSLELAVWMLQPGEAVVVARRLQAVLEERL